AIGLWDPIASFAHIADILHGHSPAAAFVETVRRDRDGDTDACAVAIFIRGFYARVAGHLKAACADLREASQMLTAQGRAGPPRLGSCAADGQRQLFSMAVQAELARAQGDYARAQTRAETALGLAHLYSDRYTVAALLVDQGLFAFERRQYADMRR